MRVFMAFVAAGVLTLLATKILEKVKEKRLRRAMTRILRG